MRTIISACFILLVSVLTTTTSFAQAKKFDSTSAISNLGFRVTCSNKDDAENQVNISPKGFKDMRDFSFPVKGRLRKMLVEDINADGYPDLMLCVYGGANGNMGNIICVASKGNTELQPVRFSDIYSDAKISEGYKGYDEFTVMVGTLMQTFPVYKPDDTDTPTGGKRVVQYRLANGENGGLSFKVLRSYMKE